MTSNNPKRPGDTPLFTAELIRDLCARLDILIHRGCRHADRGDPVTIVDMLDLYELSARLELLIETLDARRRMHGDAYAREKALKDPDTQK